MRLKKRKPTATGSKKASPVKRRVARKTKKAAFRSPSRSIGEIFFTDATEGIVVADYHGMVTTVNPAFVAMTGRPEREIIGKPVSLLYDDIRDNELFETIKKELKKSGKWQGELWNRHKNGENHPLLLTVVAKTDPATRRPYFLNLFTDISKHIDVGVTHNDQAYYDALTGLPNRQLLNDRLTFMISRAKRNNAFLGLLLIDINRFHTINDTLGYATGDQLLQSIATRLKSCIREVDTVFRLGNDAFAMILEGISQPDDATRVVKRILSTCSTPFKFMNREVYVTLSIGIGIFPTDGAMFDELMKNAQAALTRSKELGINSFQHYQPQMNATVAQEFTLQNDLRVALEQNQLVVFYQPQVDLITKEIIGAEALVRWMHPQLGMVSPAQFIPIAESTGAIVPIGEWVLKTACLQTKKWQDHFSKELCIAVNLSNRQFQQQDLVSLVEKTLAETGLDPHTLELEITESMGMKNPEATLKTLQQLKSMGIRIAIDDFGTGYSSIYYLKKFPIDTIKIDRSFVDDIVTDPNDAAIVLAMIALAHSLRLTVIAEGVENKEQLEYLLRNGCQKIQGFIYSPPVNPNGFENLIADPSLIRNLVF
ncbi:MAG: EAL domain-containing protein [Chitinispirillaceae bacterium]|nr:EAL domain-containing protein [Chitinispirillaceae bacterium]